MPKNMLSSPRRYVSDGLASDLIAPTEVSVTRPLEWLGAAATLSYRFVRALAYILVLMHQFRLCVNVVWVTHSFKTPTLLPAGAAKVGGHVRFLTSLHRFCQIARYSWVTRAFEAPTLLPVGAMPAVALELFFPWGGLFFRWRPATSPRIFACGVRFMSSKPTYPKNFVSPRFSAT